MDAGGSYALSVDEELLTENLRGRTGQSSLQAPIFLRHAPATRSAATTRLAPRDDPASTSVVSSTPEVVTPLPTYYVSSFSATLPNGSVIISSQTISTTMSPFTIYVPVTSTAASQQSSDNGLNGILAPLLGGVLGGFFGLLLIVAIVWMLWRRHAKSRKSDDIPPSMTPASAIMQDYTYGARRRTPAPPPPAYQYGLVGSPRSSRPTIASRPPSQTLSVLTSQTHTSQAPSATQQMMYSPTALVPGQSLPPTRPPTPFALSQQSQSPSPTARQDGATEPWPRLGSDEGHGGGDRPASQQRAVRVSLTLANWNPATDGELLDWQPGGEVDMTREARLQILSSPSIAGAAVGSHTPT
ncbi:hypothetical protein CERSUDRAFT_92475 [Gelatoporia subvermispora B]|uniref:Mid2 domain-containing protein n=1 Tax=Ceriporiopsis subvermispora (strain B) TaxID=914234 RepID=M2R5Z1_CERS8|nr:hypothetical protein CERSUDRAFT_92475 [Gelatoporia subvermispora B]